MKMNKVFYLLTPNHAIMPVSTIPRISYLLKTRQAVKITVQFYAKKKVW